MTPRAVVRSQSPLSLGFPRQVYWEWGAISFSGSSQPRDQTCISCIGRQILYHGASYLGSPNMNIYMHISFWILSYFYRKDSMFIHNETRFAAYFLNLLYLGDLSINVCWKYIFFFDSFIVFQSPVTY